MNDLTAIQRDTLIVLHGIQPASGIELIDTLDGYYEEEVFGGRFYPSIDELVESGLVEKRADDGRTNQYSLTDKGVRRVSNREQWIEKQLEEIL